MNRRSFLSAGAASLGAIAFARPLFADDVAAVLAEITKARASLKTLVAAFTQERTIGLLATTVKSTGSLTLVRPDRLRWELDPPDAVTYWIGPEGFAYATPSGGGSAGKAAAGKFGAVLGDLMIFLGGDLEKLRARYDLEVPSRPNGGVVLVARPKADEVRKHVRRLELAAGADLWGIQRVVLEEPSGDQSVITFTKVDRDVKVDPARMTPPK
jgi:outer membrane lipoprotein-sorting protein